MPIEWGSIVVRKPYFRTPLHYDGTRLTTHRLAEVLPHVLAKLGEVHGQRTDLLLALWPEVIGPKLAAMTQATAFIDGVLHVRVRNSTLYSLLSQHDKPRLLRILRQRFPQIEIKSIYFRMG